MINNIKRAVQALFTSKLEGNTEMWLFVGLGNPGDKYTKNRHNVGFMLIDRINALANFKLKFQGALAEIKCADEKIVLLKPMTYMNNSGQSVAAAAKFYKIPPERIIVFHDELDLKPCEVRIKKGGGNAGHNGLKSIQAHIGTADFWRVRIGIGRPNHQGDVSDYVLSDFSKAEREPLEPLLSYMAENIKVIINDKPEAYEALLKQFSREGKEKNGV